MVGITVEKIERGLNQRAQPAKTHPSAPEGMPGGGALHYTLTAFLGVEIWSRKHKGLGGVDEPENNPSPGYG